MCYIDEETLPTTRASAKASAEASVEASAVSNLADNTEANADVESEGNIANSDSSVVVTTKQGINMANSIVIK